MKSNILLQGDIGTGKTRSLITLLPEYWDEPTGKMRTGAGLKAFVTSMEPGIEATIGRNLCGHPEAPSEPLHYHYIAPGERTLTQLYNYAILVTKMTISQLLTIPDPSKHMYTQYLDMLSNCCNFLCHGCDKSFGRVEDWDDTYAHAVDGLTGLTRASRQHIIGARPMIGREDYQPIQGFIDAFLEQHWSGTRCTAILTAHTDRRENEQTHRSEITIDTAGPALVKKLVRKPDEIITTERDDRGEYVWNTLPQGHASKHRRLPEAPDLAPDFSQIFRS
jgi:hypothetical protein